MRPCKQSTWLVLDNDELVLGVSNEYLITNNFLKAEELTFIS